MSLSSDLWKLREKRLLEEKLKEQKSEEIAPVKTVTEEKAQDDSWVKSSEIWDDGYQFGDVFKTAYQSTRDLSQNILGGILDIGEVVVDTGAYLGGLFSYYNPFNRMLNPDIAEENKKKTEEFIKSDLYDGTEVIKSISNEDLVKQIIGVGTEEGSVFGEKSDSLAQSGGQLAGQLAANAVLPGSGMVLMATTAFGSEVENALNQGATFEEAGLSAAISAGAEVLTEKIGGISFGGKTLTDAAFSKLSKNMTNKVAKVLITSGKVTADALAEGGEEILSGYMGAIGQKMTYMEDKEIEELFSNEDMLDAFIGGAVLGGLGGGGDAVNSIIKGVDPVSGLTKNEQKVVEKVYNDALAEKDGKVSNSEKSKLWNEVVEKMGRGEISTDIIEEVLGDKTYKDYKNIIETEESVMKELEELYEGDELQQQIDDILNNSNRFQIKNQLSNEVSELVKGDRLSESYNEKANRSRQFEADVTKYDPKHRDTIQKAIDSGILNNTRKTHEFVDIIAKISADKGVSFDFLNNQKLKESGFAVDGKQVNGLVTESGISINIDSPKAWQSTVGHEITHVLEGTDMYDALQQTLFDYAKSRKGTDSKFDSEYKERLYNTRQLYKDVKGYEGVDGFTKIKNEVTADLVGDYLFTDEKFIKHLSAKNRNVFEKIYDEIKYLCKVATAGSKEARELEKVKKAFEDAYRGEGTQNTAEDSGVKYSLTDKTTPSYEELTAKKPVQIVNVKAGLDSGTYADMKTAVMGKATSEGWFDVPHHNTDTDSLIFLTEKSFSHAYSNLRSDFGEDTIRCMAHIPEIIENAVLVSVDDPRNANKQESKVYTFFGAIDGVGGIEPVKLTVKEYDFSTLDAVPKNIRSYFEKNGVMESYNSLYDAHALEVIGIEGIKKESDASGRVNEQGSQAQATSDSKISIADLLNLVNGDAMKYIHQKRYSLSTDSDGKQLSEGQQEFFKDSKVRDDTGNLLPVYHGSKNSGFNVFQYSKDVQTGTDYGEAYYFTSDRQKASGYSYDVTKDERVAKYNADRESLKKRFLETHSEEDKNAFLNYRYDGKKLADLIDDETYNTEGGEVKEVYLNLTNPLIVDAGGKYYYEVYQDYFDKARANGNDGIIVKNVIDNPRGDARPIDTYIAFHPEQIKNIDNLNPTDDPDIRRSLSANGKQTKYGNFSTPATELRYEAPVQNIFPVAENVTVTEELFPDDLAPMDESTENERLASFTDADAPVDVASDDFDSRVDGIVKSLTKLKRNRRILVDGYSVGVYTRNGSDDVTISIKKPDGKIIGGSLTDGKYLTNTQLAREIAEQIAEAEGYVANNEDIAPVKETYEAIKPKREPSNEPRMVTADTVGQRTTRKELHRGIVDDIKSRFTEKGLDFDKVLKSAKNLSTFATVDNTPQRVMEKSLGYKEGQILSDLTVNKVAQNETEGIKWLNSFTDRKNGLLAQISKQYNIKPGSKESAAAQMYAEGFYVDEKNNIVQYGNAELAKDFPNAQTQRNIKGLASDPRIRQIYDDTLAMINESRTRNAYPEIPRLDNYFLHFRAMEDTFSRLGLPFNPNDIRAKDLPTDLNGVTADLKPGQPYFASAMHRTGKRTSFDLLGGLEKYLSSAKNQIFHIDDIQTLRALRNYVADTYGQANGLEGLDSLSEEEAQDRIAKVYNSHLSTFAKFLNEEANILAGKTSLIDRGLEGVIGRRGITFLDTVNKQVGSNMVGFNISSSLTNFLPVAQTFAKTNKADFVKAFGQTVANKVGSIFGRNDSFTENSPVVIRRKGADRFYRTPFQKAGDAGYVFMSAVDDISTELIARTKYNELTRKGMDSQQAHYETDKWVSRLMGDRSLGQQPQLYNSKMLGLFTKFQLEVRNQLDSQFYDTIQETKASNEEIQNGLARNAKTAAKIASTFVQLAVVQHLFGKAFESVAGYNPAFDIIETLIKTFGWDDDEESEDTVLDNIEQGFFGLLEDLPYTSIFTGGRIPIESALPIEQLVTGKDKYGNEKSRLETLGEVAPYYLLPGGYGQIKKTYQGLGMFSEDHPIAGSYTDIGNLRFPVEDTLGNRLQAGIFGQYASSNARDYFDNDIAPLKENQIQEFADVGMTIQDYWDYREGLSGLNTLAEKADYINSLDLTTEQKNILINNIADRKEKIDMSTYGDYDSFDEFDFATKNPAKYVIAKSVGGYENFKTYSNKLNDIKSDKDGDGKSISGSRKEKVINYVNGLDIDYGQKIILFKSEYKSDNTYNYDIVDYLNSRNDISYDEMVTILKELGFQVSSDGYVTW